MAGVIWLIVAVSLGAGLVCLVMALIITVDERNVTAPIREAARAAGRTAESRADVAQGAGNAPTPVLEQGGLVDFGGIAQLADALGKLNPAGQLFVMSLAFMAIAMAAGAAGVAAG